MLSAPITLQDRELAFLRGLFECRVMTTDDAKALYFDGNCEPAKSACKNPNPSAFISWHCGGKHGCHIPKKLNHEIAWVHAVIAIPDL